MADVLDTDEVQDLRNWQCRDGNDLLDEQLQSLCDSHEALRHERDDALLRIRVDGIGGHELESCALVEARAEVERLRSSLSSAIERGGHEENEKEVALDKLIQCRAVLREVLSAERECA